MVRRRKGAAITVGMMTTSLMAPPLLGMAMKRVEHTAEEELRRRDQATFAKDS